MQRTLFVRTFLIFSFIVGLTQPLPAVPWNAGAKVVGGVGVPVAALVWLLSNRRISSMKKRHAQLARRYELLRSDKSVPMGQKALAGFYLAQLNDEIRSAKDTQKGAIGALIAAGVIGGGALGYAGYQLLNGSGDRSKNSGSRRFPRSLPSRRSSVSVDEDRLASASDIREVFGGGRDLLSRAGPTVSQGTIGVWNRPTPVPLNLFYLPLNREKSTDRELLGDAPVETLGYIFDDLEKQITTNADRILTGDGAVDVVAPPGPKGVYFKVFAGQQTDASPDGNCLFHSLFAHLDRDAYRVIGKNATEFFPGIAAVDEKDVLRRATTDAVIAIYNGATEVLGMPVDENIRTELKLRVDEVGGVDKYRKICSTVKKQTGLGDPRLRWATPVEVVVLVNHILKRPLIEWQLIERGGSKYATPMRLKGAQFIKDNFNPREWVHLFHVAKDAKEGMAFEGNHYDIFNVNAVVPATS